MTSLLIIMAIILIGAAVYGATNRGRYTEEFTKELKSLVDEAVIVRKDLEAVLENASLLAGDMIETLDSKLNRLEAIQAEPLLQPAATPKPTRIRPESSSRTRQIPTSEQITPPREEKPAEKKTPSSQRIPYQLEELRRAHPYIVVPRLHNEGYTIGEIAEILDKGQGEIKLILDIQKKREAGNW